jgi:hypothetical protein
MEILIMKRFSTCCPKSTKNWMSFWQTLKFREIKPTIHIFRKKKRKSLRKNTQMPWVNSLLSDIKTNGTSCKNFLGNTECQKATRSNAFSGKCFIRADFEIIATTEKCYDLRV